MICLEKHSKCGLAVWPSIAYIYLYIYISMSQMDPKEVFHNTAHVQLPYIAGL